LIIIIILILILGPVPFVIVDTFYSPKPPEDQLVVAISPFYIIDEYGKTGSDVNTAIDFKERIEAEKDLEIEVIMLDLDDPIRDIKDAKYQGKKAGAHLVIYGETKKKIGNIGAIKYTILPLPSLEIMPSDTPLLEEPRENSLIIEGAGKASFSMITEEPITIIESLKENASSAIYAIGAFENYKKSDFASAITFFESIKDYDNNSLILFHIANCYLFIDNLNESLQHFDKALDVNPQLVDAWNNKGVALNDLSRNEEAIAACDKAIEIDPQLAEPWNNKGCALYCLGRYEEAVTAYNKALEINSQDAMAWYNKGIALDDLGRYDEVITAYDHVIDINPQDAMAWLNKGVALADLSRNEEAMAAYDNAIVINPQYAKAWYNKGSAFLDLGRHEEAITAYDNAIVINPQYAEAWYNKGKAHYYLGKYEEAIAACDKALGINSQDAIAWNIKGVALVDLGRYEESLAACDKAIAIDPQCADPWNNRGIASSL
jgi:tetratricopeptide (TPR) repeat protein